MQVATTSRCILFPRRIDASASGGDWQDELKHARIGPGSISREETLID